MPTQAEYSQMPVRISRDGVCIGDEKVPGCIAADGVTIKPGNGDTVNLMTVTFIVGPVECTDPLVDAKAVEAPAETATQYSCTGATGG